MLVLTTFHLGFAAARVGQEAGVLTLPRCRGRLSSAVGDKFFNSVPTTQLGRQARFALGPGRDADVMVIDEGLAYSTEQDATYHCLYEAESGEMVGTDKVDSLGASLTSPRRSRGSKA